MARTRIAGGTITCCIWLAALAGTARATTYHSVIIDGDLSDFAADEQTAGDPQNDSDYGYNNEVGQLLVTWDADHLYLGFNYVAWGAAVVYLVETGKTGGATELCPNKGWSGAFPANVQSVQGLDLMVGLFLEATSQAPAGAFVYTLDATASTDISATAGVLVDLAETVNSTSQEHTGVVEVAIPWSAVYGLGPGKVAPGAQLQIAGAIRGQNDGDGLGDLSPGGTGLPQQGNCWSGDTNLLGQFHSVTVDADGDGYPDPGWSPGQNVASVDAGLPADAGPPPPDSWVPPDSAPVPDFLPVEGDTGTAHDSEVLFDAKVAPDGPSPDSSGQDARVPADAGGGDSGPGAKQDEGCACSAKATAPPSAPVIMLALLGLVALDRRRRQ